MLRPFQTSLPIILTSDDAAEVAFQPEAAEVEVQPGTLRHSQVD